MASKQDTDHQEIDKDLDGEFLTDSAVTISYIKLDTSAAATTQANLTILTTNVKKATQQSQIQVTVRDGNNIHTRAYTMPNSRHNLFCLADIIDAMGVVVLTSKGAYLVPRDIIMKVVVAKNKQANKVHRTYSMSAKFKKMKTYGTKNVSTTRKNTQEMGARAMILPYDRNKIKKTWRKHIQ